MLKSSGWVPNTKIETIRRKIKNEGRDEVSERAMQESNTIADVNDENVDINHTDIANDEPIRTTENGLSDYERDRLLRLREALGGDDFGKTEMKLKYEDNEKINEEVIKIKKVLEYVKTTGFAHYRNVTQAAMRIVREVIGMKRSNTKKKQEPFSK